MKNYVSKNSYPIRAREIYINKNTAQADPPFLYYGLLRASRFIHRTPLRPSVFVLRPFTAIKQFWSNFMTGFFEEERFFPEPRCLVFDEKQIEPISLMPATRDFFIRPPKGVPLPQPPPPPPPTPEIRPLNPITTGRVTMEVRMFSEDYPTPPRQILPPGEKPKPYTVGDFKRDVRKMAMDLGCTQVGVSYYVPGYHHLLTYGQNIDTGKAKHAILRFKFENEKLFIQHEHNEKVTEVETQYPRLPDDNWDNLLKYLVDFFATPSNFTGEPCFVESEILSEIDFYRITSKALS